MRICAANAKSGFQFLTLQIVNCFEPSNYSFSNGINDRGLIGWERRKISINRSIKGGQSKGVKGQTGVQNTAVRKIKAKTEASLASVSSTMSLPCKKCRGFDDCKVDDG